MLHGITLSSEAQRCCCCLPGLGGRELLEILQRRRYIKQLLVESQREVEVHHRGVVDGQTADDPDQVKPVLLNKTLETHTHTHRNIIY